MATYFKAVRPDGTDFRTGKVRWLPEDGVIPEGGWLVKHPTSTGISSWSTAKEYLSVSTFATDCTCAEWPCRLLAVESVGRVVTPEASLLPNKRAAVVWRVVRELPATDSLGPQGEQVAGLIEQFGRMTVAQLAQFEALTFEHFRSAPVTVVGDAEFQDLWNASRRRSRDAAGEAVGKALAAVTSYSWALDGPGEWKMREAAVVAVLMRDLIHAETFNALVAPWESVMGTQWTR